MLCAGSGPETTRAGQPDLIGDEPCSGTPAAIIAPGEVGWRDSAGSHRAAGTRAWICWDKA